MHKIFEGIYEKSIGRVVFDILDPFNERSPPSKDIQAMISDIISEKMDSGRLELMLLCDTLMDRFTRREMAETPVHDMAKNWMTIFNNLPKDYEARLKEEMERKKRHKSGRKNEAYMYSFIDEFRRYKEDSKKSRIKQIYESLKLTPLDMVIYHHKTRESVYEPVFMISRVKRPYKFLFKAAKYIVLKEDSLKKDKRKGIHMSDLDRRNMLIQDTPPRDVFGLKVVSSDMAFCYQVIEFVYKKYNVVNDKDYYKHPSPKKPRYRSRHITIISPQNKKDFIDLQFLTIDDFMNNDFWELNHPNKDAHDFNTMSKDRRFKELYKRGKFLLENLAIS